MQAETFLPALNATLNGTAAVLLLSGRRLIAAGKIDAHRRTMIAAVCSSALFLISYVTYHSLLYAWGKNPSHHFAGHGIWRPIYFAILLTHTILAVVIVPMVLVTLNRGLKRQDFRHRAIARVTYPLWLYVSVTGVVIYFMLYQIF